MLVNGLIYANLRKSQYFEKPLKNRCFCPLAYIRVYYSLAEFKAFGINTLRGVFLIPPIYATLLRRVVVAEFTAATTYPYDGGICRAVERGPGMLTVGVQLDTLLIMKTHSQLAPKRAAFCLEYMKDSNATQAAIRAGYSKKTARSQGNELLTIPDVQAELSRLRATVVTDAIATYERACARMAEIMETGNDSDAIRACDRLAKLRGWDQPAKVAPTTPDGTEAYQPTPAMTPDEIVSTFGEAIERAVNGGN